ncbi:cytochrome P450 [Streptomyces anulatus]|uniref:cytochrome P450 n=1 Tax=Streptomyces anulatus TaxID=1892 RepID=UPI002E10E3FF|nr:cytochrome P450 [Streptomyces anulatus]WSR81155.1 cytochrome P450 [Streptomyces anulatus]
MTLAPGHEWIEGAHEGAPVVGVRPAGPPSAASGGGCPHLRGATAGESNGQEGRRLRASGPAPVVELPGGVQARVVVDPGLAERLSAGPHVSRDAARHWPGFREGTRSVDGIIHAWIGTHNALNSYGEDHRQLRAPIAAALTRRRVEAMAPEIELIVHDVLDGLGAHEDIDLVQSYALPIPHEVITRLLGVPAQHLPAFSAAAAGLFDTSAGPADVGRSMEAVLGILDQLVASARERPEDNLIGDLVRAADASESPLSDTELRDQLMLIIIAGTETTVHAIGTLLVHLLSHPDQRALVMSGQVSMDAALAESLRLRPPIAAVPLRFAVRPFEDARSGEHFGEGEPVLIHLAAAGLDPERYAEPERFDVQRAEGSRSLAFGYGPHVCPGAALATREVVIAVRRLLERYPDVRLTVEPEQLQEPSSWISNGYTSIPGQLA